MKRKSWFTMLEITIVILIIAVLLTTLKGFFNIKKNEEQYAHVCVNNIYGEIIGFVNSSITSKGLFTWDILYHPDYYNIILEPSSDTITLGFEVSSNNEIYKRYSFTGNDISPSFSCYANSYKIKMGGDDLDIKINKWLQATSNSNLQTFTIDNDWTMQFTGSTDIYVCDHDEVLCKNISQFIIDSRTHYIIHKKCFGWETDGTCSSWDQ